MTRLRNASTASTPFALGDGVVIAVRAAGASDGMT